MSALSFSAISSVGKFFKDLVGGWDRFWFAPADPTPVPLTVTGSTVL